MNYKVDSKGRVIHIKKDRMTLLRSKTDLPRKGNNGKRIECYELVEEIVVFYNAG